jgi:alpha-aminoadipic semialdehyde synthase
MSPRVPRRSSIYSPTGRSIPRSFRDPERSFVLQEYYDSPELFRGMFSRHMPHLSVLVNCIFWTEAYPRLITREQLRELFAHQEPKLKIIADLSCDVEGSVECTLKCTDPGNPAYVYLPREDRIVDGWEGRGPVILAVDNLPCEIPRDSTEHFSRAVREMVPELAACDFQRPFQELEISPPLRRALIVHRGRLTPDYEYLEEKLSSL